MKKHTQWQPHVEAWRESVLSQADYCRQQSLNAKAFPVWVRRCQRELSVGKEALLEIIPLQVAPSVPVTPAQAGVILRFPRGAALELSTAISPRWLAELLQCLS